MNDLTGKRFGKLAVILDALNSIAYYDDSQVVYVSCRKKYAEEGSVLVKIEEV